MSFKVNIKAMLVYFMYCTNSICIIVCVRIPFYLQDLLNFDDPLNVEASELYFKNKVRNVGSHSIVSTVCFFFNFSLLKSIQVQY